MSHSPPEQLWTQSPDWGHFVEHDVAALQVWLQSPPGQSAEHVEPAAQTYWQSPAEHSALQSPLALHAQVPPSQLNAPPPDPPLQEKLSVNSEARQRNRIPFLLRRPATPTACYPGHIPRNTP
jgi:hypothetical protein